MHNFKNSFKIIIVMALFTSALSLAQNPIANKAPIATMVMGPNGTLVSGGAIFSNTASLSCVVDGITISTSGSVDWNYSVNNPNTCTPLAPYSGLGNWTGLGSTGFLRYTFSQPITSVRVSYSSVNGNDIATMSSNSASSLQFYDFCGLAANGNILTSTFGSTSNYGTVGLTIASVTPFSTITLTNTGGQSGWVVGNPCNFIMNPPTVSPNIVNCPKVTLDTRYYNATDTQNTTLSVFTAGTGGGCPQATINGVPCTAANVTIEVINPLPFGCTFNANGTISIPAGTLPFYVSNQYNYRFRSIANPNIVSVPYRVDFGIQRRVLLANTNNIYLTVQPANSNGVPNPGGIANPYGTASNLIKNVLTGSTIYTSTTGGSGTATANFDAASAVTVTNEAPFDPYFMINPNGDIVYRPPYSFATNTIPLFPQIKRELKFKVCLTGSNQFCNDGSSSINYFYPPLRSAPSSTSLDSFTISPNPIKAGVSRVSFEKTIDNATLEIHALTGEKLHTQKLNNTTEELLLLDKLPKGIYVLKIITENQTVSKKISIE